MTYNTPELLLVGAAQNLVLEASPRLPGLKEQTGECFGEDSTEYQEDLPTW